MDKNTYKLYIKILEEELIPAMGCTEPIAIAFAAARAAAVLGEEPTKIVAKCSGNIIKNAMCVTVPNTDGLVGIKASSIIGAIGGDADKGLEVISKVTQEHKDRAKELMDTDYCTIENLEENIPLHIQMEVYSENHSAMVEIKFAHNNISKVVKDGKVEFEADEDPEKYLGVFVDRSILSVKDIYEFSNTVDIKDIKSLMDTQIEYNMNISKEGMSGEYGVGIGNIILKTGDKNNVVTKMKAYTSAASEARMSGSAMPVMTNSGSGNQGMTVSIPVILYVNDKKMSDEKLYRGLVFSNLITIHEKAGIGRLSAFCGSVVGGCAVGAAITYLEGGSLEQIDKAIVNTFANISGIVCDGAKPSCGSKIATCIDAGMMAHYIAMEDKAYDYNTGIIKGDIEETISAIGRLGKYGMQGTDKEILEIMIED